MDFCYCFVYVYVSFVTKVISAKKGVHPLDKGVPGAVNILNDLKMLNYSSEDNCG